METFLQIILKLKVRKILEKLSWQYQIHGVNFQSVIVIYIGLTRFTSFRSIYSKSYINLDVEIYIVKNMYLPSSELRQNFYKFMDVIPMDSDPNHFST